jgi:type II restriction enzyme
MARAITENWFEREVYCLACTSKHLQATRDGTPFKDFSCPKCGQPYELKSSARVHGDIVTDGGYDSMMRKIQEPRAPALMLAHYSPQWCIEGLLAIHPVFLIPEVVRKRGKPHIRPISRKPYWMCDFNLAFVPADGRIALVKSSIVSPASKVRQLYKESLRFAELSEKKRGWAALVLAAVRKIGKTEFTLAEVYAFEQEMHAAYPQNSHVRDKIRQQMQVLRDLGYLEFAGRGEYRVSK